MSQQYRDSLQTDIYAEDRIYIDPRRIEYAPISGTESYYENLSTDPVPGQYSLSGSTSSGIYMIPFSVPITFDVLVKPLFAYDIATDQEFFVFNSDARDNARVALFYKASTDQLGIRAYTSTAGASATTSDTMLEYVYISNAGLQSWKRLTCVINSTTVKIYSSGRAMVSTSIDITGHKNKIFLTPGNGVTCYINHAIIYPGFVATQAQILSGYKDVPNEHIYLSFNKCGIGRTRCDVTRSAFDYNREYKDGYNAETFSVSLHNNDGRYSADQYATYAPSAYSYNGLVTEQYLANNKIGLSLESRSRKRFSDDADIYAYYSCDTLPEIPDNAAGTTYVQDAWATVDGWSGTSATVSVSGGELIVTSASTGAYRITRAISFSTKDVRLKIRNISGTRAAYSIRYTISTEQTNTFVIAESGSTNADIYLSVPGTATSISIRADSTGSVGDSIGIDWIYIGSGLYDTPIIDNAGNVQDLTVYGSCPVPGISGNGISRNGISSYERSAAVLPSVPDILHYEEEYIGTQMASSQGFMNYKPVSTTVGHCIIYRPSNSDTLSIQYTSGSASPSVSFVSYFTGLTLIRCRIAVEINWTTGAVKAWRNGVYFGSQTMTTPVKPTTGSYIYYGSYQGALQFARGTFDERVLYNSAISDTKVLENFNSYEKTRLFATDTDAAFEPLFYGTTNKGAFPRSTMSGANCDITISADDLIKNIAERKIRSSRSWESYYFSRATPSNNSLLHEYIWLASKKELYNYFGNSGFENTTIGNSWLVGGSSPSFARSTTIKLLGSYSGYLTGTSGLYIEQNMTRDFSIGEVMTFQVYAYSNTAITLTCIIYEYTGITNNGSTSTAYTHSGKGWDLISVTRAITNNASTSLKVQVVTSASGVYFDLAGLYYGGVKTFYASNTNDGTSGIISDTLATMASYDQIGIDAEDVTYIHPYAVITKGDSPWDMVKQICDATICRFFHIFQGVLRYRSYMTSDHASTYLGVIPKTASVSTMEQPIDANKITVEGVIINTAKADECVFSARANSDLMDNSYSDASNTVPNTLSFTRKLSAGERWPSVADYPKGFELRYEEPSAIESKLKGK